MLLAKIDLIPHVRYNEHVGGAYNEYRSGHNIPQKYFLFA